MKVNISEPAEIVLSNLNDADRRRVWAWINNLERWETDAFIRQQSKKLDARGNNYMLITNADFVVFFALEKESIMILDVAKKSTILRSSEVSGAG